MKIALAQLNYHVGNFTKNTLKIKNSILQAKHLGADLIVFSELSVCGYPPKDMLNSQVFVENCLGAVKDIASVCHGITAVVGSPSFNRKRGGKILLNSAFVLSDGLIASVYHKGLMPTYDVFNEYRYFEPAQEFHTVQIEEKKVALTICEDIWNVAGEGMYAMNPPEVLAGLAPDFMINISASPFAWNHLPGRMRTLSENARRYSLPLFSVNLIGGQTDLLFDGGSAVFNPMGKLVDLFPLFQESLKVYDLDSVMNDPGRESPSVAEGIEKHKLILDALIMGVRDYFEKTGQKQAILGLSGGIDSAVSLVIAHKALGRENVWAVLLPGPYSSNHSVTDALALAKKLGVRHDIISINDTVTAIEKSLGKLFQGTNKGLAEENIQARARAIILMALSNKFGHMLLNTSNKSEAAVGYGTLYGDMCGGLSVLGDVYKTDVYGLAQLINNDEEIIPVSTIEKPPSAELKPDQKDTDSLPDYDILDQILYAYFEEEQDPETIIGMGWKPDLVYKVLKMVDSSEYKRRQSPPTLRVSLKCPGIGRELPIEASYMGLKRLF